MSNENQKIKIDFPAQLRGGVYANNMVVSHTKEEFILDFMLITPPVGTVTSRVIMSPGHMKRMVAALQENLKKYEDKLGRIEKAEEPQKGPIGFHS